MARQKHFIEEILDFYEHGSSFTWKVMDKIRSTGKVDRRIFMNSDLYVDAYVGLLRKSGQRPDVTLKKMREIYLACAMGAWRPSKDIVSFDSNIYDPLIGSDISRGIPGEVLTRLPAWSVFIETPRGFESIDEESGRKVSWKGFFVNLDGRADALVLNFVDDDLDERGITTCAVRLALPGVDLGDEGAIRKSLMKAPSESMIRLAERAIPLVLYICANGIGPKNELLAKRQRLLGSSLSKKGACKTVSAPFAIIREIGRELGEEIAKREASERGKLSGMRKEMRPHMRRAHFQGYWTGPRQGERKIVIKWIPPILVAMREREEEEESLFPAM